MENWNLKRDFKIIQLHVQQAGGTRRMPLPRWHANNVTADTQTTAVSSSGLGTAPLQGFPDLRVWRRLL